MIGSLLTFLAVGVLTLVIAGIVLSVVSAIFSLTLGLATFLLFKVAPLLLVGWVVLKLIDKVRGGDRLSPADRQWLEGE